MSSKKYFFGGATFGIVLVVVLNTAYAGVMSAFSSKYKINADAKIKKIISVLDSNYVNELDLEKMEESMYAGLVYGLGDPYTTYMDVDTFDKFMEQTEGTYAGIGVVVSIDENDNRITVITPYEGAPGAKAGIIPGDKITKVNGFEVFADNYEEAVAMLKGHPGTSVEVQYYRPTTNETFDVTIVREQIDIPTVSHKMLDDEIGYLRITNFDRVTYDQFVEAYTDLNKQNMKGLVIDLRNNPGGLLDVVTKITDFFVPEGYIVYTEDKKGEKRYTYSDKNQINIPLAVLVNGYSASASEVMSGAIKDMNVGSLVGTQTYGKGLVQNLFDLRDGSALKITIAKYYTPSGVCINGEGLTPDYIVELPQEQIANISSLTLEEDVQLQKAVDVVLKELRK